MFGLDLNRILHRAPDLSPVQAVRPHTRPVVLVPGFRDTSTVFRHLTHYLQKERFDVHALTLRPSDGRIPLDHLAHQVADYVEREFSENDKLDFVGFSMGGIVLRYYMQRLGGLQRADHFVTLGSPHRGTWMAYSSRRPGVRQMRPGSAFLVDLAQDESRLSSIKFTSIWTPLDLTIVPASSSVMPVGKHHPLMLPYHRALISHSRALQTVAQILRSNESPWVGMKDTYGNALRQ